MAGISVIGQAVDRRYLEGQPNPTDEFDLLYVAAARMLGFGSFASFWLYASHFRSTPGEPTCGRTSGFLGWPQKGLLSGLPELPLKLQ
jgi:hypothetical protein